MIYYIVFQLAYLDVNPCWFSMQWLDAILSRIRAIRILWYANELMLVLPWSKSSRNSFRKFKIQFYSSKVILSPSKYSPSTATHLCQRLIQLSKHFWNSIVDIAIRAVFDFSITSFRLLKRVPRNGFLIWSKKSVSQHFQGFHIIESIFNAKFNTNLLLQIQLHF